MKILLTACLIILFSAKGFTQVNVKALALVDVSIIDANHQQPLPHQTVLITGERILGIFPDGKGSLPDSAVIFYMHGKFLVPGLIDTHVHMATDPSGTDNRATTLSVLNKMLQSGITSVRDMAGDARTLASLSRDALTEDIPSPNIYYSALMAGPEFFTDPRTIATTRGGVAGHMPYMQAVSDTTNLVLAVAEAKGTGATGIKLYADISASLVSKIVAEAKKQHMMVWGHAWLSPAKPSDLVRAGVGSISHGKLIFYETRDSVPASWKKPGLPDKFWKDSLPDEKFLFSLMKEHNTILDATLATYKKWGKEEPANQFNYEITKMMTINAYKAGVKICAGTDDDQEGFVQNEMSLLVHDAGFSPIDALIAATQHGAEAIGIQNKTGTIEINKSADLLVLNKNPLDDIDNIKSVYLVIKDGKLFKN
jgi:imidazolonepropionase-like amidohydrolase